MLVVLNKSRCLLNQYINQEEADQDMADKVSEAVDFRGEVMPVAKKTT